MYVLTTIWSIEGEQVEKQEHFETFKQFKRAFESVSIMLEGNEKIRLMNIEAFYYHK